MEMKYKQGAITWLRVTDYMHGWIDYELGCEVRAHGQRVVCVQHMEGARTILRTKTVEDMMEQKPLGIALSATRRNCLDAGMKIDPDAMKEAFGVTKDALNDFIPVECPKLCMTQGGVLRPWTLDVTFSKEQARAMQQLLRNAFWSAVEAFDREYAKELRGVQYVAKDMIEEFCRETRTPEYHVESIRREWQRRRGRRAKSEE